MGPRRFDRTAGRTGESGITIIELLVVIVIVSILLAIGVPIYLAQRDKAADAQAQAAADTAVLATEAAAVENEEDGYVGIDLADLRRIEGTLIDAEIALSNQSKNGYTVEARSSTNARFEITRLSDGSTMRTCEPSDNGACRSDGTWG